MLKVDRLLDEKMMLLKCSLSKKLQNIQLDLIRQMVHQESSVEETLQSISASNKRQKKVVQELATENARLRQIQF